MLAPSKTRLEVLAVLSTIAGIRPFAKGEEEVSSVSESAPSCQLRCGSALVGVASILL